jgi:hypothetical protein
MPELSKLQQQIVRDYGVKFRASWERKIEEDDLSKPC